MDSPAATLILGAALATSLVGLYASPGLIERNLLRPYWFLRKQQYATLVTSAFVHAGIAHLLFNALTLWSFGFPLERRIGSARFVALYAFGLIASGLGTVWKQRRNPEYACLGASGAILAVLFASIVYFPTQSIMIMPLPVPIPAPLFAFGYLAYTLYASRHARGRINHDAHLGGALAGLAFVALTDPGAISRALDRLLP
ncbi:MAG: rhomboid family intramembrane serine protease [Steroidobacteraceae bacterium]